MISFILLMCIGLFLPMGIIIWLILERNLSIKVIILGFLSFFIPQMLIRIPIISWLAMHYPTIEGGLAYKFILPLTAGIAEVVGDYICIRLFMKKDDKFAGIGLGVCHGLCENMLLVILPALIAVLNGMSSISYWASFERFAALIIHVACAMFAYYAVKNKKVIFLIIGILIHGFADLPIMFSKNIVLIEVVPFIIGIISIIVITYILFKPRLNENLIN